MSLLSFAGSRLRIFLISSPSVWLPFTLSTLSSSKVLLNCVNFSSNFAKGENVVIVSSGADCADAAGIM